MIPRLLYLDSLKVTWKKEYEVNASVDPIIDIIHDAKATTIDRLTPPPPLRSWERGIFVDSAPSSSSLASPTPSPARAAIASGSEWATDRHDRVHNGPHLHLTAASRGRPL